MCHCKVFFVSLGSANNNRRSAAIRDICDTARRKLVFEDKDCAYRVQQTPSIHALLSKNTALYCVAVKDEFSKGTQMTLERGECKNRRLGCIRFYVIEFHLLTEWAMEEILFTVGFIGYVYKHFIGCR